MKHDSIPPKEIQIVPIRNNPLTSISEVNPTYHMTGDCPFGIYPPEGADVLPIFVKPDRNIVDINSAKRYISHGIQPIIPLHTPICHRVEMSAQGWWVAWTPKEFAEIFATPLEEDEVNTALNENGYTRIYIQTETGNSQKLMDDVRLAKELFGEKLAVFVDGVYTYETYEDWCDIGAEYVKISDKYFSIPQLLLCLKKVKNNRIAAQKYCTAVVAECKDVRLSDTFLALGADFLMYGDVFKNCLENSLKFVDECVWTGITRFRVGEGVIADYERWLEGADRFGYPGLKKEILSMSWGKYHWPDYRKSQDKPAGVAKEELVDIDDNAVYGDPGCPCAGGFGIPVFDKNHHPQHECCGNEYEDDEDESEENNDGTNEHDCDKPTRHELIDFILLFDFRGRVPNMVGITNLKKFYNLSNKMKHLFIGLFRPEKMLITPPKKNKKHDPHPFCVWNRLYPDGETEVCSPKESHIPVKDTLADILDRVARDIMKGMFTCGNTGLHDFINSEHTFIPEIPEIPIQTDSNGKCCDVDAKLAELEDKIFKRLDEIKEEIKKGGCMCDGPFVWVEEYDDEELSAKLAGYIYTTGYDLLEKEIKLELPKTNVSYDPEEQCLIFEDATKYPSKQ